VKSETPKCANEISLLAQLAELHSI